jgi:L-aminopeptidase/D-esterase-like protein
VVVATDAPFLPHQLKRLAQRPSLALGRMGSSASNGSGDIFIAFSTASEQAWTNGPANVETLPNDALSAFFLATVQATEEAIVNALVAGREMAGAGGRLFGIPHDELRAVLQRFGRLRQ